MKPGTPDLTANRQIHKKAFAMKYRQPSKALNCSQKKIQTPEQSKQVERTLPWGPYPTPHAASTPTQPALGSLPFPAPLPLCFCSPGFLHHEGSGPFSLASAQHLASSLTTCKPSYKSPSAKWVPSPPSWKQSLQALPDVDVPLLAAPGRASLAVSSCSAVFCSQH